MKKSFGFTFIEMVVAIGVMGLVLPVLFTIIFLILRQQVKIIRLQDAKKQGDNAISIMSTIIKNNAGSINSDKLLGSATEVCKGVGTSSGPGNEETFFFADKLGTSWFNFYSTLGKISSNSAALASPEDLTSDKVYVSNFLIGCTRKTTYSPAIVSIDFYICYNYGTDDCNPPIRPEEVARLHYQTIIKLRSY